LQLALSDKNYFATNLPYLKTELSVTVDHFEIGAVGRYQAGAIGTCGERDQDVEVQVAQLACIIATVIMNSGQQLARLQPIPFRRRQDWMIPCQCPQKFPFRWLGGATPQLSENYGTRSNKTTNRFDSFLMAPGAKVIDEDRGVEDYQVTQCDL